MARKPGRSRDLESVRLLAHELNQPLAAIVNYADACRLLLEAGRDPAAVATLADDLERIAERAHHAGDLVHQILAVAAPEARVRAIDLNSLLRKAAQQADEWLAESSPDAAPWHLDLQPGLDAVLGVERSLELVLRTLLVRPDADRGAGAARVTSRAHGEVARIEIEGSAHGADEHELPALRICRLLLERQNGRLWRGHDDGREADSRLTVQLPFAR